MLPIILTPELWMVLIVFAAFINYLIGQLSIFKIFEIFITKYQYFFVKLFDRGSSKKIKGLISWIIIEGTMLISLFGLSYFVLQTYTYLYIFVNLFLLTCVLGQRQLTQKIHRYSNNLEKEEFEDLYNKLEYKNTLGVNSRYDLGRAILEECAEAGITDIIGPILYMYLGILTSNINPFLNPVILAYFFYTAKILGYGTFIPHSSFNYYPISIFNILCSGPSYIGSFLYIFTGALSGYNYDNAFEIYQNFHKNQNKDSYGLPTVSIAGLLGLQLSLTKISPQGHIIQRIVGEPEYQLEVYDINETMHLVFISEIYLLILGCSITLIFYILYMFLNF